MRVRYGSYTHAEGEVALSVTNDAVETEGGDIIATVSRWQMSGHLIADGTTAMDSAVAQLTAAYAVDGRDLVLLLPSGSPSHLQLLSRDCNGGTKVMQRPSFPDFRGAGYTGYLPYSIVVEGTRDITGGEDGLINFSEQLSFEGGGPRFGMRETLNGLPIRQQLRRATIYRATQAGTATGRYSYPTPPRPLWPGAMPEAPKIVYQSPRRRGSAGRDRYTEFVTSWQYVFESPAPLRGRPTIWR